MKDLVADASVIVKWLLPSRLEEHDTDRAVALLESFARGEIRLREPVHWLIEVAAVLGRLSAATADDAIVALHALTVRTESGPEIDLLASRLARQLDQHFFDTLYHAVALSFPDCILVTADERYYRKARRLGSILLLHDLR